MSISIFYITDNGLKIANRVRQHYPDARVMKFRTDKVGEVWQESDTLVFIMASGIVVRTIAPLIKDKKTDPGVIVIDEKGQHVISLLSGHLGGANEKAKEIAEFIGGEAVITTSSDINELPSIDIWARDNDLVIENWDLLPKIGTKLINKGRIAVWTDLDMELPAEFERVSDIHTADIMISHSFSDRENADIPVNKKKSLLLDRHIVPSPLRGEGGGEGVQQWRLHPPLNPRPSRSGNDKAILLNSNSLISSVKKRKLLKLRPRDLMLGIGCNSRTSADEIGEAVGTTCGEYGLSPLSVAGIATIDIKKNEPGLMAFAERHGFDIISFTPGQLNGVKGVTPSDAARKATGAQAVAEPAAILGSSGGRLIVNKQKIGNVTVAVAEINRKRQKMKKGKIFVVGTGPGSIDHITPYAQKVIRDVDVIVGYGTYLDLIREMIKGKEVVATGMTQEIDRCRKAVELAAEGRTVAVISGGDPGIYAMAGLVLELLKMEDGKGKMENKRAESSICNLPSSISVEIVPGISALNACASRLGAPLMHDFAAISLSDRLTPWDMIEKRLDAAASADFVIALYNPKSKGRAEHINRAREIVMRHRKPDTPVGIVKGAMRENESVVLTDLENMLRHDIDMQTTVIIGNSKTVEWNGLMITPRGYERKKQYSKE